MSRSEVEPRLGWASDSTESGGGDGEGGGPEGVRRVAGRSPLARMTWPSGLQSPASGTGWLGGRELARLRRAGAGWPPRLLGPVSRRG